MARGNVLVVGAGVVGLSSALRLLEAGYRVAILARELPAETTSSVAAAIWLPYAVEENPNVERWGRETLERFLALASEEEAAGVRVCAVVDVGREPRADPWWKTSVPDFAYAQDVNALPPGYVSGFAFRAPVIDMSRYLGYLEQRVTALGGAITQRGVAGWDEAFAAWDEAFPDATQTQERHVIVNCAGLGARELVTDDRASSSDGRGVHAGRGQVTRIQGGGFARALLDDTNEHAPTYIVPRVDDIVLGGTHDDDQEDRAISAETRRDILMRCAELAYFYDQRFAVSLAKLAGGTFAAQFIGRVDAEIAAAPAAEPATRVAADECGLRPLRSEVRLEVQAISVPGLPECHVVHNYGHGGSGVTLSWGCAGEVARLVEDLIP